MIGSTKHRHIRTNLGEDGNGSHRIIGEARHSPNQTELEGIRFSQTKDFLFDIPFVHADLIDMLQAFSERCGLFTGYGSVDCSLKLCNEVLAASIDERRHVELLTGMFQNEPDDGT